MDIVRTMEWRDGAVCNSQGARFWLRFNFTAYHTLVQMYIGPNIRCHEVFTLDNLLLLPYTCNLFPLCLCMWSQTQTQKSTILDKFS